MAIYVAKLRQYSIGTIVFGILIVIFLIFGILGLTKVFYQEIKNPTFDEIIQVEDKNDPFLYLGDDNKIYSKILSVYICAISFSMFSISICFWLFFSIKNFLISKKIDNIIKSDLKKLSIINFFTLTIGSIMQLATCNLILEKFRKKNQVNNQIKKNNSHPFSHQKLYEIDKKEWEKI